MGGQARAEGERPGRALLVLTGPCDDTEVNERLPPCGAPRDSPLRASHELWGLVGGPRRSWSPHLIVPLTFNYIGLRRWIPKAQAPR